FQESGCPSARPRAMLSKISAQIRNFLLSSAHAACMRGSHSFSSVFRLQGGEAGPRLHKTRLLLAFDRCLCARESAAILSKQRHALALSNRLAVRSSNFDVYSCCF